VAVALQPAAAALVPRGPLAERLRANLEQWLLVAPGANPAMTGTFRLRERLPRLNLVPWYGEFPGKYLQSAAIAYRITRDGRLRDAAERVVRELAEAQSPEGYLGPHPRAERLTGETEGERGEDLPWWRKKRKLWDAWGHYHVMLGLLDWHEATGSDLAWTTCIAAADHVCREFEGAGRSILEAGEPDKNGAIIHVLCRLYGKTGKPEYLAMARNVERSWDDPSAGGYLEAGLTDVPFHRTRQPRWESLHSVQGLFELYRVTGDARYARALENLWWSMVRYDRHNTGGFGSGEAARGDPYDPRPIETCCTVAWTALGIDLLRLGGDPYVADELELSTFSGLLGAQHPTGRWWTYNTPMDGVRKASAHDIVFQAMPGSPEINCCSVNGPRGLGMIADWALMRFDGGLALNWYGPGTIETTLPSGRPMRIIQRTRYPAGPSVRIGLALTGTETFELRLRIPGWSARTRVAVNGEPVGDVPPGSYLALCRAWRDRDAIALDLDLSLHWWAGAGACAGKVALYRGPLLLACDQRFNGFEPEAAPPVDRRHLRFVPRRPGPGEPVPWVLGELHGADGRTVVLCDFATAGMTGSRYASWLPGTGFTPAAFERGRPEWMAR
jgi:hypothetical protein